MKKIILIICFILVAQISYAELWVCQQGQTLRRFNGDGYVKGICGQNNTNILPNCIEATKQQYDEAGLRYKKLDSGDVIDWTQAEIDAYIQAENDAKAQSILDAIDKFEVTNLDLLTALIKRINARIPSNPITKQEIIDQIKLDKGL